MSTKVNRTDMEKAELNDSKQRDETWLSNMDQNVSPGCPGTVPDPAASHRSVPAPVDCVPGSTSADSPSISPILKTSATHHFHDLVPARRSERLRSVSSNGRHSPYIFPKASSDEESLVLSELSEEWLPKPESEKPWLDEIGRLNSKSMAHSDISDSESEADMFPKPLRLLVDKCNYPTSSVLPPASTSSDTSYESESSLEDTSSNKGTTTDSEEEEATLLETQILEEIRQFSNESRPARSKSRQKCTRSKSDCTNLMPSECQMNEQDEALRKKLKIRLIRADPVVTTRLSCFLEAPKFSKRSKCGLVTSWILDDNNFCLPKLQFARKSFLSKVNGEEVETMRKVAPEFHKKHFTPMEDEVLLSRAKVLFKSLKLRSREVFRILAELALASTKHNRALGKFIMAAYIGRPMLHYRSLHDVMTRIFRIFHINRLADETSDETQSFYKKIYRRIGKAWNRAVRNLGIHKDLPELIRTLKLEANTIWADDYEVMFLIVMKKMGTWDLINLPINQMPATFPGQYKGKPLYKKTLLRCLTSLRLSYTGSTNEEAKPIVLTTKTAFFKHLIDRDYFHRNQIDWNLVLQKFPLLSKSVLQSWLNSALAQKLNLEPGDDLLATRLSLVLEKMKTDSFLLKANLRAELCVTRAREGFDKAKAAFLGQVSK